MRESYLGYTFTFDRGRFWEILGNVPRELRQELVHFGLANPPRIEQTAIDALDFERLSFQDPRRANIWQEYFSDTGDDDDLMALIRMLRRARCT